MAWSWGGVTLPFDEEPVDGAVPFIRRRAWAFANPRGATGRLKQKLYNDALEGRVHLMLSQATKDALQAVFEADTPVMHVNPRPPYDTGITVLITEFTAIWDTSALGENETESLYNCNLVMVED